MLSFRIGVLPIGCSASVVVSDCFNIIGVNRPFGPRASSPRLGSGFWSVDFNCLLTLFLCNILFLSVVNVCLVQVTASCSLVLYALSILFLFTLYPRKRYGKFFTNVLFEFEGCFHHQLIVVSFAVRECVHLQCFWLRWNNICFSIWRQNWIVCYFRSGFSSVVSFKGPVLNLKWTVVLFFFYRTAQNFFGCASIWGLRLM